MPDYRLQHFMRQTEDRLQARKSDRPGRLGNPNDDRKVFDREPRVKDVADESTSIGTPMNTTTYLPGGTFHKSPTGDVGEDEDTLDDTDDNNDDELGGDSGDEYD